MQTICKNHSAVKPFARNGVVTCMNALNVEQLLRAVTVATPCTADWDAMRGDDRRRFCEQCGKHVYNFSALTSDEAAALIRDTEGRLCGGLFIRKDGRVKTSDCARAVTPSGVLVWLKRAAVGSVTFACAAFAFLASARMLNDRESAPKVKVPAPKFVNEGVEKFHQWIFPQKPKVAPPVVPLKRRMEVTGVIICPPQNPPPLPPQPPTTKE